MLKNIKGMNDILPSDSSSWRELENKIISVIKFTKTIVAVKRKIIAPANC